MSTTKDIALSLAAKIKYQPLADMLLVKPLKPVMISKLVAQPPAAQPASLDELDKVPPVEPQKTKVEANVRKGVILKLGIDYTTANPAGLEVGDIVVFPAYAGMPFELLKDSRLIRRYEVVCKVTE